MGWGQVLLIVVAFCGSANHLAGLIDNPNLCRHQRVHCIKNGVALNPAASDVEDLIDACLENPSIFPEAKPMPKPSVSPSPRKP